MKGFDRIFGDCVAFSPAIIGEAGRWLPPNPHAMTGGQLAFFEHTPCLCHATVATPVGVGHLIEAGHPMSCPRLIYQNDAQAIDILKSQAAEGRKLIINHLPLPTSIAPEAMWVDPKLVSRLNNKAALADWVPREFLPRRRVVPSAGIADDPGLLPCVLKVATDSSTGGGADLMACHSRHDFADAFSFFRGAKQLVVEDWIEFTDLWCLNFACTHDGKVEELGSARQLIDSKLAFFGNLFGDVNAPPHSICEVVLALAQRLVADGYCGILGVDVGRAADGSWYLYDINARMNASTAPLLALRKFPWLSSHPLQRSVRLQGESLREVVALSRRAVADMRFLPLSTFDPGVGGLEGAPSIGGIVAGADLEDIQAYLHKHLGQHAPIP